MSLTAALVGKTIAQVLSNGEVLRIVCDDGFELDVVWADTDARKALKGVPLVVFCGKRVHVNSPESAVLLQRHL